MTLTAVWDRVAAATAGRLTVIGVRAGGEAPSGAFHGAMPRLIVGIDGALRVAHRDGSTALPAGTVLALAPGAWFRLAGRGTFANLAIRESGVDLRLRGFSGGTPQPLDHALLPRIEEPLRLAFALVAALVDAGAAAASLRPAVRAILARLGERRGDLRPYRIAASPWLRLVDHLGERLHRAVDRAEVAADLGWHPGHVSRICAGQGETFVGLVRRLRLTAAEDLLRRSMLSVQDISRRCGFATPQHFVRCFRSRYGVPPGAWRAAQES